MKEQILVHIDYIDCVVDSFFLMLDGFLRIGDSPYLSTHVTLQSLAKTGVLHHGDKLVIINMAVLKKRINQFETSVNNFVPTRGEN